MRATVATTFYYTIVDQKYGVDDFLKSVTTFKIHGFGPVWALLL